ncbi:MAG: protein-L-isoaspartate(D-aspartate) O-methyltransferase [Chloroflexi bacterium]|nr:protein-L-isoaspartate(D-aspartate) O-methyltransferase [Chloroflexota bacterium]
MLKGLRPWHKIALLLVACLLIGVSISFAIKFARRAPQRFATPALEDDAYWRELRLKMVREQIASSGIQNPRVLAAMEAVPRHAFVPPEWLSQAYDDHPLPIGYGQTISQPYVVALMTELLDIQPGDKVLEIGTGSGYQAAILAQLTDRVYTIEIVEPLCLQAAERLKNSNVHVRCADGYYGWEEYAPYDGIIVTCAPDHIPQPLVNQLADGGRMVIPVGPPGSYQTLWLIQRKGQEIISERIGYALFVPLLRSAEGLTP